MQGIGFHPKRSREVQQAKKHSQQTEFTTPHKNIEKLRNINMLTSKKNIEKNQTQDRNYSKPIQINLNSQYNQKTIIYEPGARSSQINKIKQKQQQDEFHEYREKNQDLAAKELTDIFEEKAKNFKIIAKTLHQYLKEQQKLAHNSPIKNKSKNRNKKQRCTPRAVFTLKMIKAFNEAQIKNVNSSAMKLIDSMIDTVLQEIDSEKRQTRFEEQNQNLAKNNEHIGIKNNLKQKKNEKHKKEKQRQVIYSQVQPEKKESQVHISLKKEIKDLEDRLYGAEQEGLILEDILQQFKDIDISEKRQCISELEQILEKQQQIIAYLSSEKQR